MIGSMMLCVLVLIVLVNILFIYCKQVSAKKLYIFWRAERIGAKIWANFLPDEQIVAKNVSKISCHEQIAQLFTRK